MAPLVAIMLVVIIVSVAVVVDLGHIHNVKVQLQRAVDAAALAGANQLNGSAGAVQAAKDAAVAVAAANRVDQESVIIVADDLVDPDDPDLHYVQLGTWDAEALGSPASVRFVPTEDSPNAVKVTATRSVDHVFFFFSPATDVRADAIAVAKPDVPILPLAIVTCIPAEEMLEKPGSLPDMSVCGITAYKFDNDQEDTAAWTSLSFSANANDIAEYMETDEGREKFNNVIFGKNLPTSEGIENEPVDDAASLYSSTYGGCPDIFPYDYNINCGLGQIAGKELATPEEFTDPSPPPLTQDVNGAYQPNLPFDPLTAYGINGALPRWYNLNDEDGFQSDDHFTRVWTQDGILLRGSGETLTDYVSRLESYANCTDVSPSACNPYGDDRFKIENFIVEPQGQFRQNLIEALNGFDPDYWPDFRKVPKHAGYPKVGIINGNATTVIQAFVDNEYVTDGSNLRCSDNEPFPEGQTTLRVNAPVIFAGSCEDWSAISNPSPEHGFTYIGLSKLLLTRVWTNQLDYDCGDDFVQLNGETCEDPFIPGLSNDAFRLPGNPSAAPSLKAIEGLTLVPVADDEEDQGSILKVYLVE